MIETNALCVRYPRTAKASLSAVSISVSEGVTALLGANGSGKTTLLRTLSGALDPTSGQVTIDGLNPYLRGERREALRKIAFMPQTAAVPRELTAVDFVAYLTWMRDLDRSAARAQAMEALAAVGLASRADDKLKRLSGGMVRRVWLAQALAAKSGSLLLDEPSTGLDPRQRATMVELIRERTHGAVLLSSHIIEDVLSLASSVIVLREGKVVHQGPLTSEVNESWLLSLIGNAEL
ncbi:ABC transporter ATP-binding protein [uncultured Tessaracoccus sp.]|uniref:ABC transporter ATP-binding protein n=1 Tax=uncultured Tessaracoccus sp. TaxID=905023 RepID=UPI00262C21C3|nr:ATP-binding cassette domain-containing protein [uncultured Tessaracoccus sp.]